MALYYEKFVEWEWCKKWKEAFMTYLRAASQWSPPKLRRNNPQRYITAIRSIKVKNSYQ
jgi:hypothetical protein